MSAGDFAWFPVNTPHNSIPREQAQAEQGKGSCSSKRTGSVVGVWILSTGVRFDAKRLAPPFLFPFMLVFSPLRSNCVMFSAAGVSCLVGDSGGGGAASWIGWC